MLLRVEVVLCDDMLPCYIIAEASCHLLVCLLYDLLLTPFLLFRPFYVVV